MRLFFLVTGASFFFLVSIAQGMITPNNLCDLYLATEGVTGVLKANRTVQLMRGVSTADEKTRESLLRLVIEILALNPNATPEVLATELNEVSISMEFEDPNESLKHYLKGIFHPSTVVASEDEKEEAVMIKSFAEERNALERISQRNDTYYYQTIIRIIYWLDFVLKNEYKAKSNKATESLTNVLVDRVKDKKQRRDAPMDASIMFRLPKSTLGILDKLVEKFNCGRAIFLAEVFMIIDYLETGKLKVATPRKGLSDDDLNFLQEVERLLGTPESESIP